MQKQQGASREAIDRTAFRWMVLAALLVPSDVALATTIGESIEAALSTNP